MEETVNKKRIMSFTLQWHLTSLCPNRCKHCYIQEREDDSISYEKFQELWARIKKFEEKHNVKMERVSLTGGDPFLAKDIWKIIELLKDRKVAILGIPERVTLQNIEKMKQLGVGSYQVSLDGMPNIHDYIRGKGSFEKTIKAVQLLSEHGIKHSIMFTVNTLNYNDLIPLIKYLDENQIHTEFAFDFMVGNVDNVACMPSMVNENIAKKVLLDYFDALIELKKKGSTVTLREKNNLIKVMVRKASNLLDDDIVGRAFCGGCSNGIFGMCVLPNGDVYPCRRLPLKVGNLYEQELEDIILHNELMRKFRDSTNYSYCKDCFYFNICRGCPGVAYYFSNDPFGKYPYCFLKEKIAGTEIINKRESMEEIMECDSNTLLNMEMKEYVLRYLKYYKK